MTQAPSAQTAPQAGLLPAPPPGWTAEQWAHYGPEYMRRQQAQPQPATSVIVAAAPQLLPGVTIVGGNDNKSPMVTLSAYEKMGKSTTAMTTLRDWPEVGLEPIVLAFDPHGPDACVRLGYHPHVLRVRDQPGNSNVDKARAALGMLAQNIDYVKRRYGAIIIDCASTMVMQFHDDAKNTPKNKANNDTRAPYFELGLYTKEIIRKVMDLQLPSVWLAWLQEGSTNSEKDSSGQNKKSTEMGGPDIMGRKVRNWIAGTSHHNFVLEKYRVAKGERDPWGGPADEENFVRVIHTRPWGLINAGGRYSHLMPDPAPANLGWILSQITGRGRYAPGAQAR